ncbi:MAG: riboflavin synthase [Candidatus Marinimicrobia bacterium]|nr:riboflavin synthase [Candidatus Neomarinimicrobiota bacterium]
MFTGIIEETGTLIAKTPDDGAERLVIRAQKVLSDLEVGHSIAINGVCLTVIERTDDRFSVQVIPETMERSNLGALEQGAAVNLERAMAATARFHGHMVQGHVETVGIVNNLVMDGANVRLSVTLDERWLRYCLPKGSITLDGVSLTIADQFTSGITVALIPFTLAETTLGDLQVGDQVNIETDIMARYLDRFLEFDLPDEYDVDPVNLQKWGYGES